MRSGFLIISGDEGALLEHSLPLAVAEGFDDGLIVDNASSDATADVARRCDVARMALPQRLPFTAAMNAGLRRLQTDAVAFLHADTFLQPGYRAACLDALSRSGVGSVAPKLLRATGPGIEERLALIDTAAMSIDRRRKNSLIGHGQPATAYAVPGEVFGVDGAAAMYRRQTLEECAVHGNVFDPNMPGQWATDVDLAWRARLQGWSSHYAPAAVVHHIRTYSPTTRASLRAEDRRTQFLNRYLMMAKNDSLSDLLRDAGPILLYEVLALGYALLREPELLPGYLEAARRLPEALRWRRFIQARRRVRQVPFGLRPPAAPA